MAVAPLSRDGRDYVRAFDLTSIALWRDGRLGVCRNPTGAQEAWWCPAQAAGQIVRAANANGKDVPAAAARLHVPLRDHHAIDAGLNIAKQRGDLAFFNGAYKARRRAAQAEGHGFMTYGQALRRLRKAVAGAAANGGQCTRSVMLSVFGE